MILDRIQKIALCHQVRDILKNFGKNQEKSELEDIVNSKNIYRIETDGKIIILYDFVDPDVFVFNSFEEFKDFVMKKW